MTGRRRRVERRAAARNEAWLEPSPRPRPPRDGTQHDDGLAPPRGVARQRVQIGQSVPFAWAAAAGLEKRRNRHDQGGNRDDAGNAQVCPAGPCHAERRSGVPEAREQQGADQDEAPAGAGGDGVDQGGARGSRTGIVDPPGSRRAAESPGFLGGARTGLHIHAKALREPATWGGGRRTFVA